MLPLASPPMVPKPQLQEPQFAFLPTTHTRSPTGPLSVVKSHRHLHPPKLRHPVRVLPTHPRLCLCPLTKTTSMPLPLASRRPKCPVPPNRTSRFRVLRTHTEWDSPASSPRFPKHLQGEKEWPRSPRTGSGRQRAASRARPLPQHGLLGQRSARSTCSRRARSPTSLATSRSTQGRLGWGWAGAAVAGSGEKARGGGCRRQCLGSLAAAPPLSRGQGEPRMRVLALDPEPGARRGGLREEARL